LVSIICAVGKAAASRSADPIEHAVEVAPDLQRYRVAARD